MIHLINICLNNRAIIIKTITALLLISTVFISFNLFIESNVLSKRYTFILGSTFLSLIIAFTTNKWYINRLDISVLIFGIYIIIRTCCSDLIPNKASSLLLISFLLTYFSFSLFKEKRNIELIIITVCIVQAMYGLLQYFGFYHTNSVFKIVGNFDNPAGFAVCLSVGSPFCLSLLHKKKWKKYFGFISAAILAISIVLSDSRTGLISIVIISAIYFGNKYLNNIRRYFITIILFLIIVLVTLFFYKEDSSLGRFFIWENSIDMVMDKPIFGQGAGFFIGNYMNYQAKYFEQNPNNKYSQLADNVTHPLNEFLILIIEYGVIGLILLCIILFVIAKSHKQLKTEHLCLISIIIFSLSSYPLRYPFILVILAYCLSTIEIKTIKQITLTNSKKIALIIFLSIFSYYSVKDIMFETRWCEATKTIVFNENNGALLNKYSVLFSNWNGNPLFLYNYGAVLNRAEKYDKSNEIMSKCMKYYNDYDVQMILADNYFKLEQWDKAEKFYKIAHYMIPNKFMPLYKLMTLYDKIGNKKKSLEMAYIILNKTVKIPSATVTHIQKEAKEFVKVLHIKNIAK